MTIKNVILGLTILMLYANNCSAQIDTTIKYLTPNLSLFYYSPVEKDTLQINNVTTLVIQGDNLLTQSNKVKISQLTGINIKTGQGKFSSGMLPGAIGGLVTGLIVGSILDNKDKEVSHGGGILPHIKYALVTIPVGAILGTITGGLISSQLPSYSDFDLRGTTEFKRNELKRLLNFYGQK